MFVLHAIIFTVLSSHRTQTGNLIPNYQTHTKSIFNAKLDFAVLSIYRTQTITLTPTCHFQTNSKFNPNPTLGLGLKLG